MFFLRCAFWLSVMYASVSWGAGVVRGPHAFAAATADGLRAAADVAVARATDWCAERPTRCARDAARMTALVETTTAAIESGAGETVLAVDAETPLPVPDPRRRTASGMLTDAR